MNVIEEHGSVTVVRGDLFDPMLPVTALVNPVNCVGVMGAGLAKAFKQKATTNYHAYKAECDAGRLKPGKLFVYDRGYTPKLPLQPLRYIINFPTKDDWRDPSQIQHIDRGLHTLRKVLKAHPDMHTIAMPALGCGLGGLPWLTVRETIITALIDMKDKRILLFEPI